MTWHEVSVTLKKLKELKGHFITGGNLETDFYPTELVLSEVLNNLVKHVGQGCLEQDIKLIWALHKSQFSAESCDAGITFDALAKCGPI